MSSRKYSPFPNWDTLANTRNAKSQAKQAAYRAAARSAVVAATRANYVPARLPIVLPVRQNTVRTSSTEVKSFDVAVTASAGLPGIASVTAAEPSTAFVGLTELNCIRQGSTFYNRIGSKLQIQSVRVSFDLTTTSAASAFAYTARYILIYDRQPNGAFPAIADILGINDSGVSAAQPYASINIANRSRFSVIRDKVVEFDTAKNIISHVDEFCPFKCDVEYKANAGNIGDISTGAIYLLCFNGGGLGSPTPIISNIISRIRYLD